MSAIIDLFTVLVTLGVDTHKHSHTAVALDAQGRVLGEVTVDNTRRGFARLLAWAQQFGVIDVIGIEGAGSYGAPLHRWLASQGMAVVEVTRTHRGDRARRGKSDSIDAHLIAKAVQASEYTVPKAAAGPVEALRVLRLAHESATVTITRLVNQLHGLVVTAPEQLRDRLAGLDATELIATCATLRPGGDLADPVAATKYTLRQLACRCRDAQRDLDELDAQLDDLTLRIAPRTRAEQGVGPWVATTLLTAAGDNPDRLRRGEASYAALCGSNPVPASSGQTTRHRLNRGGNRQANRALHTVVRTRLAWDERTQAYMARRTAEGKSKRDVMRCLKRYIARHLYATITADLTAYNSKQPTAA